MAQKGIPIGVAVVGVLAFLAGLVWLFAGAILFIDGIDDTDAMVAAAVSTVLGLAFLLFGLGCLKGWGWVWTFGVVILIISMAFSVYSWYLDDFSDAEMLSTLVSIGIALVILLYLNSFKVKNWFGKL
ncbi:MAG: hypothetical protein HPY73_09135 [Methanomassiliicoccales archaeon]|nr:MAG: hypothetical protein HPY73_09135 [Methanomassiliicoccales archaeon]